MRAGAILKTAILLFNREKNLSGMLPKVQEVVRTRPAFQYIVNVPHTVTPATERFFRREIELFREKVEAFPGRRIDDVVLAAAVDLYNRTRRLVWKLYCLRRELAKFALDRHAVQVAREATLRPARRLPSTKPGTASFRAPR